MDGDCIDFRSVRQVDHSRNSPRLEKQVDHSIAVKVFVVRPEGRGRW